MAFNPADITRLEDTNSGSYNATTNPYGLGNGGHRPPADNFPLALQAVANVCNDLGAEITAAVLASAVGLAATSSSSVTIGSGTKTFNVGTNKSFTAGMPVMAYVPSDPETYVFGYVLTYSGSTLTFDSTIYNGTGTYTNWVVTVSGRGAVGPVGPTGPTGPAGSGTTITVQDDGVVVTATPRPNLNYTLGLVAIDDPVNARANISVDVGTTNGKIVQVGAGDKIVTSLIDTGTVSGKIAAFDANGIQLPGAYNVSSRVIDKGTVSSGTVTFDLSQANVQKLTVAGALTVAISNKPTGAWELQINLINGGAASITWPTVSWLKGDGTTSTTFGDQGVTLQAAGANTVILWGEGSGTVYGRAG